MIKGLQVGAIPNLNDGSNNSPRLRVDMNYGNLRDLPDAPGNPKGDARALHEAIRDAGYTGVQDGDPELCRELNLRYTMSARTDTPAQVEEAAQRAQGAGAVCMTLHVGTGIEDDATMDSLADAVINASQRHGVPLYIETHRATMFQDMFRTVKLIERYPDIRVNADYSHWYTGLEMKYGDLEAKWRFIQPVFDRVSFMHGRIGNPSHIQVNIGDGSGLEFVDHFREMWIRSYEGFIRHANPGDYIVFTPELLPPVIYYAREFPGPDGQLREESNRWEQAQVLSHIARECFADAERRVGTE
jgi:hypothetical protein